MAATTTLLGLVTPTQGTLSGTWGDTVNYGISDYVDIAIAGTLSFAGDGAITLANTLGSASGNGITTTTAQYMVIRVTGTLTTPKIITGPSYSKLYMVDNSATGSTVTFKAAGQSGISVAVGEKCFVYYNGTDYVKVSSSVADGVTTIDFGSTGLTPNTATSGAVTVAGTLAIANGGTGTTSTTFANLTTNVTGTLPIANGGTGTTSTTFANLTTNVTGILPVANGGTATATPALVQGTGVTITGTWPNQTIAATGSGGTVTSVDVSGGTTGLTTSGGPISTSGTITLAGTLAVANGGTGITSLGAGVATFLGTPSSANLASAVTDETGSGLLVFATSPTLTTPLLGTPTSGVLSNCTVDGTNKVGYLNVPQSGSAKTTSYTLAVGDVGEYILLGTSGAITIPDATFAAGDVVSIFNNTGSTATITCSITTAYIAGTFTDKATMTLAAAGVATVLFISGTVCVVSGNVT
jgi:hypothetical protein